MTALSPRHARPWLALATVLTASGCVATTPATGPATGPAASEPLRVSNAGRPFAMWEGAAARKAADAACGGAVRASIYDRFDRATGEWVYPGGCA
jgi:hypothetical protein